MANVKKVTKRDYFNAIKAAIGVMDQVGEYAVQDVTEFIDNEIAKLDNKAAKAKEKAAEKKAEGDALKDAIKAVLTAELQTADEITAAVEGEDLTKSKVVARLTQLVKDGVATKEETKTEAGKRMAYKLA